MSPNDERKAAIQKMVYESITDEELMTPVGDLSAGRVAVLQAAFAGPYGPLLVDRLDRLGRHR